MSEKETELPESEKNRIRQEYNQQILAGILGYLDILEESVGKPASKILEEQSTDCKKQKG